MSSGKVILGVLAGVAVGAAIGILFAPDKGEETRKKMSEKGQGYVDDLEQKFNDLISRAKNKFEEAEEQVSGFGGTTNDMENIQGEGAPGM